MYHDLDSELIRAWQLLHELSDSNARNRDLAAGLRNAAHTLQVFLLSSLDCKRKTYNEGVLRVKRPKLLQEPR